MHPDKLLLGAAALKHQNHISCPPFATLFLLFLLSFEVQVWHTKANQEEQTHPGGVSF